MAALNVSSCWISTASIRPSFFNWLTIEPRTILFNLSGHGLIDMAAYDQYLAGDLTNYEVTDADVEKNLSEIEKIIK